MTLIGPTPAGEAPVRVDYPEPIEEPAALQATVKLAHRARAALETS